MKILRNLFLTNRLFFSLGICIFLFAVSYAIDFLFYVALGLLSILFLTVLSDAIWLFKSAKIKASREVVPVLSLNDKNVVRVFLSNLSSGPLYLKVIDEIPFQFNVRDLLIRLRLEPSEARELQYSLTPTVRGEYSFGDLHVFVRSKIGLVAKKERFECSLPVAVYPSLILMGRQQLSAFNDSLPLAGDNKTFRRGQSYEFDQIKSYTSGDDTRNINWKASSTLNKIMINCYEDERSQQIYSIIDKSRVMKASFNGLTLLDYAINATLAFSNIVLKKQDKAGLIIFSRNAGAPLKADRGNRQLRRIMYALYKEKYDYSEANYDALYITVRRSIPNRSLLFLYTNFDSIHSLERNMNILRLLNKSHLLVVFFFDDAELEDYSRSEANDLMDVYHITVARKLILEKDQIVKELQRNGITAIKSSPEKLSSATINKYLELKARGAI